MIEKTIPGYRIMNTCDNCLKGKYVAFIGLCCRIYSKVKITPKTNSVNLPDLMRVRESGRCPRWREKKSRLEEVI